MDGEANLLGFKPQKPSIYNKLLPYSECLDEESQEQLAAIKGQLGRTIQLRDIKIGATHWTGQLSKYIRLYGYKFSKEDHLVFVRLLFDLVTAPDQDPSLVTKFSSQLVTLLKKKDLLRRDDLELPWRPLYKLLDSIIYSPYEHHGLQLFPASIETTLKSLVANCRMYFSLESTQEMLDEWRPLLCPFDTSMLKGMYFLELFLPTLIPPEHHDQGFKLWFDEFIGLWDSCQNSPTWEAHLVNLFSRLADDTIGYIDWKPYIPKIFTRVLRSFNLPVGTGTVQVGRSHNTYEIHKTVTWMTAMMGGENRLCQDHVQKMFTAIESFYHPSNHGKWHNKLFTLMHKFPAAVVKRLHRERIKKPSWQPPVPDSNRLADEEVTQFVQSMKPILLLAMFSKVGSNLASAAFHHMAVLRPELIIPPLLERTYPALETLTEPHRLIACLNCTVAVSRSMLQKSKYYSEGSSHVLPLLNLCLPGIDPNDVKKSLTTFQLISTLASLVPMVDCSEAVHRREDLTDDEKELCSASSQFEDFVLQFLDRIFSLIENSAAEHTRSDASGEQKLNQEESMLEVGLLSTFNAILQQSSDNIYKAALDRLFNFVSQRFFEIRVAGRYTADLCRAATKVNPEMALKRFIPYACDVLKGRFQNEDLSKDEHLDTEILWHLKILSEVVRCNGIALLPYKEDIVAVLEATLHLKCKEAAEISGNLLRHTLKALTLIYTCDYKSVPVDWDRPVEEYVAIRDWGKSGNIDNLELKWHIPSHEEKQFAQELMAKFLIDELEAIKKHTAGEIKFDSEELTLRISVIVHCMMGAGSALPNWTGPQVRLVDSMVSLERFGNTCGTEKLDINLNGQNVREMVLDVMKPLLDHMLESSEDDTKSLLQMLKVYATVMFFHGTQKDDFDGRWKSLHVVKRSMENKLLGSKNHIRALLVDRVQLQHELRVMHHCAKTFTPRHQEIFQDLFKLCISRYPEVRKRAQQVLGNGFHLFAYSYRAVVQEVVKYMKNDPSIEHHQFKGALFVLQGESKRSLITKRSWEMMNLMWPALVQAQHSEKPSILRLIDQIADKLHNNVESTELTVQVPESCTEVVNGLWITQPSPSVQAPDITEISTAVEEEKKRTQDAMSNYKKLVLKLVDLLENGDLRWKFSQMAMEMLGLLTRHDTRLPAQAVKIFVKNLTHDTIQVRKICINGVSAVLKQQKRKHKKKEVDPYSVAEVSPPADRNEVHPGDRPDNQWHHYQRGKIPDTQEQWEGANFVDKTHWGYYTWPKQLSLYGPSSEQPELDRSLEDLTPEEAVVYEHFSDPTFVSKLIEFLSLEEQKGKDKFHPRHFTLFKGLFRNFGDTFIPVFRPHLERLVQETKPETHETSHRCAAEIISGILRGSKHWPFQKVQSLNEWLLPVIKTGLSNMSVETVEDWGTCFATAAESRDPRKVAPVLEILLDNPLNGEGGSFGDSSRLYCLQGALSQQEWRIPSVLHHVLTYIEPHLTHPYKNVRDRIGSVLTSVFMYDFLVPNGAPTSSPRKGPFIERTLEKLEILRETRGTTNGNNSLNIAGWVSSTRSVTDAPQPMSIDRDTNGEEPEAMEMDVVQDKSEKERKEAIRFCKTVMKWVQGSFGRMLQCAPTDIFKYLPILAILTSESTDDELRHDCAMTLACMAQSLLPPDVIPQVLHTIKEVSQLPSWHARATILTYTQVMVFCNFFHMQNPRYLQQVRDVVLNLLCDDQLEVREVAAVTLGGFLHCAYLSLNKDLRDHFSKLSKTKIKKQNGQELLNAERLIKRHAGVLGLSACIQAFPYDVPEFMPEVLMDLSGHLDDPQPIQMTVKKALSNFRRTHHDNWQDHKQKFTDDQLVVLTDLLVSPNYYA